MAKVIVDHFAHLKQPACDYLSQGYQISYKLNDLIEALKQLLSLIQEYTKSSHNLLDKGQIPVIDLLNLNLCQTQGIKRLREAAEDVEALNGFEAYSKAWGKQEVAHG